MNNNLIEGFIMLILAWCVRKYPDGITIIYSLKMVSNKDNLPYIDYVAKCLFWILFVIGIFQVFRGLYEMINVV